MAVKKDKILNVIVEIEQKEILKKYAESKGISISQVIREYIEKQLTAELNTTKIILSLPNDVSKNQESLGVWLNSKVQALLNHFKNGSR